MQTACQTLPPSAVCNSSRESGGGERNKELLLASPLVWISRSNSSVSEEERVSDAFRDSKPWLFISQQAEGSMDASIGPLDQTVCGLRTTGNQDFSYAQLPTLRVHPICEWIRSHGWYRTATGWVDNEIHEEKRWQQSAWHAKHDSAMTSIAGPDEHQMVLVEEGAGLQSWQQGRPLQDTLIAEYCSFSWKYTIFITVVD